MVQQANLSQQQSQQQPQHKGSQDSSHSKPTQAHVDAISQLFTELELAYHNQFHKAFPDHRSLTMAKQLWLKMLADLNPASIVEGGRKALGSSDFLPTFHSVRKFADQHSLFALPDTRQAYLEACNAGEPKRNVEWSHPIVYHAGKATGWFTLAT